MSANGYLTPAELRPIAGGYYAAPGPAAAWNAANVEAKRDYGITLRVNGPDSAYRSFPRQEYWRDYWCGRGLCQNAAVPGTSNHGLGWAFDVPEYVSAILEKIGAKYGFRRECSDAKWESWHWKWCGGWSGPDPGPLGSPVDPYPTLKKGDEGAAVRRMQKHLKRWNLGLTRPTPDGGFGEATAKALREFQVVHHLPVDGVCGAKTWAALRRKDHFMDAERRAINIIAILKRHGVTPTERPKLDRRREWCAQRAHYIQGLANQDKLHRAERHDRLKQAAGDKY